MHHKRRVVYLVASVAVILVCLFIGWLIFQEFFGNRQPELSIAQAFISALLKGDNAAQGYLHSDTIDIARGNCPGGTIIGCSTKIISPDWGQNHDITFAIGTHESGATSVLFHTWWSNLNEPVSIVIVMEKESDRWVVRSWRGFVIRDDPEHDMQFLRGEAHYNEFPN